MSRYQCWPGLQYLQRWSQWLEQIRRISFEVLYAVVEIRYMSMSVWCEWVTMQWLHCGTPWIASSQQLPLKTALSCHIYIGLEKIEVDLHEIRKFWMYTASHGRVPT